MEKRHPGTRAWYAGKNPPPPELVSQVEAADESQVLYDHVNHDMEGEYVDIMKSVYNEMDTLKRNPSDFRTWTPEDGNETFLKVIFDFTSPDLRERVQILQQLGTFKFRSMDGPDEKKTKIAAIFAEPDTKDYATNLGNQARRLGAIWTPKEESLLYFIINQPAQVGRMLAERLSPTNTTPFKLVGHPFADIHTKILKPLTETKTVAYSRDSEIHLVMDVRTVLEAWDQDSEVTGGCEQFNLLETLLLHEIVELVLIETDPEIPPLYAHIIACTFERYLKDTLLSVAVEDFFLSWPQPSNQELEAEYRIQIQQQMAQINALLGEDEMPDDEEDDNLDDLPLDDAVPLPKKKKKKKLVKKKVLKKKRPPE